MGIKFGDIAEPDNKTVLCYDIKHAVVILVKGTQIIPLNQMYITPMDFRVLKEIIYSLHTLEGTWSVVFLCVQWNPKVLISDLRLNCVRSFRLNSLELDIYFLPSGNTLVSHCGMH